MQKENHIKNQRKPRDKRLKAPKETESIRESPEDLKTEVNLGEDSEKSKYQSKNIVSNWAKYDLPQESYDEIEEHQNIGADYEKISQIPPSSGGHFQFKHEKTWTENQEPSIYTNYFEVDMENLALALCTIPFYERNNLHKNIFTETDLFNMENRSMKYKQKLLNNKSFKSPEIEIQDKIIGSLKTSIHLVEKTHDHELKNMKNPLEGNKPNDFEQIIGETITPMSKTECQKLTSRNKLIGNIAEHKEKTELKKDIGEVEGINSSCQITKSMDADNNQVIRSPEDLEKWLDDFLDD